MATVLVNGVPDAAVEARDRGLAYGDGVFRTLAVRDGAPRLWVRQVRKLQQDCAALDLACPDEAVLAAEARRVAASCGRHGVVKIIVTRGPGERGYAAPRTPRPTRIVLASALPAHAAADPTAGVRLYHCRTPAAVQPRLAGIKHLNRLENVLARQEWGAAPFAEGLMCDPDGNAIGGTMSNLFALQGDTLHTPDLRRAGVAGVQRERLLELAARAGLRTRVAPMPMSFVMQADELLLCNSVIGLWRVRELDGRTWDRECVAGRLRALLAEDD